MGFVNCQLFLTHSVGCEVYHPVLFVPFKCHCGQVAFPESMGSTEIIICFLGLGLSSVFVVQMATF